MVLPVFVSGVYYLCIFVFDLDNIYAHNIKYLVFFLSSIVSYCKLSEYCFNFNFIYFIFFCLKDVSSLPAISGPLWPAGTLQVPGTWGRTCSKVCFFACISNYFVSISIFWNFA